MLLHCLPLARLHLLQWEGRAARIPDGELRRQALGSLRHKAFHSLGASTLGAAVPWRHRADFVAFAVALQTISDYLDNLSDRSRPLAPRARIRLHRAMVDAVDPLATGPGAGGGAAYYRDGPAGDDGGYLTALVAASQAALRQLPGWAMVRAGMRRWACLYGQMQVRKHLSPGSRRRALAHWYDARLRLHGGRLAWWEFAAAAGSTLPILALATTAAGSPAPYGPLERLYFPWMAALHILLDYFIDRDEDRACRELNFAACYPSPALAAARMARIASEVQQRLETMHPVGVHRTIAGGLAALYLTDPKASQVPGVRQLQVALEAVTPATARLVPAMRLWRRTHRPAPPQVAPLGREGACS